MEIETEMSLFGIGSQPTFNPFVYSPFGKPTHSYSTISLWFYFLEGEFVVGQTSRQIPALFS